MLWFSPSAFRFLLEQLRSYWKHLSTSGRVRDIACCIPHPSLTLFLLYTNKQAKFWLNHSYLIWKKVIDVDQGWVSGEANEAVPCTTRFQRCRGPPFDNFALSFCIVLLKRLWTILEAHLISSEASHMFFKIMQKLCANAPKGPL